MGTGERTLSRRWRARAPGAGGSQGMALVFAGTRTRFERVALRIGEQEFAGLPERHQLVLNWAPGTVPAGLEVELTVTSRGEVPLLARVIWIADKIPDVTEALVPVWLEDPGDNLGRLEYLWRRELELHSVHVETRNPVEWRALASTAAQVDLLAERRRAVEIEHRVRSFWLELDERTDPGRVAPADAQAMARVSAMLFQRIEIRADFGRGPTAAEPARPAPRTPFFDPPSAQQTADLGLVSHLFADLHAAHLILAGEDLFPWAFEQFSLDAAAVFHHDPFLHQLLASHGAPDGSEYFKFAELALQCHAAGIEAAFWEPRLLPLVRSAHAFAEHVDVPAPGSALMGAGAFAFRQGRWTGIQRRAELREEYDDLLADPAILDPLAALEDRFSSILAQALCDTDVGATTVPGRPLLHPALLVRDASAPAVP